MSQQDESPLIAQRRDKLARERARGNAYPNDFRRDALAAALHAAHGETDAVALADTPRRVRVAGRMMTRRVMGKAAFAHVQDGSGRIQVYVRREDVGAEAYAEFKDWDLGDVLGVEGVLFRTRTGELSVQVEHARLLAKSLRPLPEKFHGLTDQEACYRQRYLDLIVNPETRRVFELRSRSVEFIRRYLSARGYVEVETPMMQLIPGGAAARPFITHHNALDLDLYLRVAPELFLKRLVVGGIEKVFEINRNFRNEGLSTQHNPEFTMLEFYEAYADYRDLMDLTEDMLRELAVDLLGTSIVHYQGADYDLGRPFTRMTLEQAVLVHNPDISHAALGDLDAIRSLASGRGVVVKPEYGLGKLQLELFEKTVESHLRQPAFITAYPAEVSPLARRNDADPFVTDRFELFIAGRELA
ncbi:MAG: lysine--tRNA ligase, partial [Gammaproteobacteria bacterium]|nr:lysine--tRNA ligase [Gammaproteobacteria bacterium]